ncbi:MAG TPA: TGS domain-containing protein, partial [Terriglobales bacterium]
MSDSIHIKLPDGSTKEVPKGTTALDVARSISPRLAEAALAAKIVDYGPDQENPVHVAFLKTGTVPGVLVDKSKLVDLTRPIEKDAELRILTDKDPEALEVYRHSSAHLLAAAVLELFPETKLGHGPSTESGFFYDFYRPT